ncbi:ABC transporter permease [Cellulomonas sp. NPDC089187]|uniref:ABC transporter permease n=1 Tax=Cellulomonas sp. NPDC089187 TaxID=3154970 RepID=UPI00341A98B9
MTGVEVVRTALAVAVLLGVFLAVTRAGRVSVGRDTLWAVARAAVQLALVALVIAWIFRHPAGIGIYLPVMVLAAAFTAARRIGLGRSLVGWLALTISAGAAVAVTAVLASGALTLDAATVLPFTAQMIGGAMSAAAVSGGRLREDVRTQWAEVEGWIALGARPWPSVAEQARHAVRWALVPGIDQTRSAGLVTLPGAFVGLLLGGASPALAAQVQLLVLIGLLAASAVSGVLTVRVVGPRVGGRRPAEV